jgi:hypothetical protein
MNFLLLLTSILKGFVLKPFILIAGASLFYLNDTILSTENNSSVKTRLLSSK